MALLVAPIQKGVICFADEASSVVLGGRKVAVARPRVRRVVHGEIALPTWAAFAGEELLSDQVMASVLAGVS
ncbi:MAG: hypothetical protein ACREXV_10745, partial [Polaromonas sp.]